jgi:hypothetical protein
MANVSVGNTYLFTFKPLLGMNNPPPATRATVTAVDPNRISVLVGNGQAPAVFSRADILSAQHVQSGGRRRKNRKGTRKGRKGTRKGRKSRRAY